MDFSGNPYSVSKTEPRCVIMGDIRGDFRLLHALLHNVAKLTDYSLNWTCVNTTLVILGNFCNRYDKRGYTRKYIGTKEALVDEEKIIETFSSLRLQCNSENQNQVIVLVGDHELSNVMELPQYRINQIQQPSSDTDRAAREKFNQEYLIPFIVRYTGVVARWGPVYLSHGSINKNWLHKLKATPDDVPSIEKINQLWRRWSLDRNVLRLKLFEDPDSPLYSSRMLIQPGTWREQDELAVLGVLGNETNPKYVQSSILNQLLTSETWDPYLRKPRKLDHTEILVSRDVDGEDQIYSIHNGMADVFCQYGSTTRVPQALCFVLKQNELEESLYVDCGAFVMDPGYYAQYQQGMNCSESVEEIDIDQPLASEPGLELIRDYLDKSTRMAISTKYQNVKHVLLFLFNYDQSKLFMVQKRNQMSVISAKRNPDEMPIESVEKVFASLTGGPIPEMDRKAEQEIDFEGHTRILIRQLKRIPELPTAIRRLSEFSDARWISVDTLWDESLSEETRKFLCILHVNHYLPEVVTKCPEWLFENAKI